MSRLTLTLNRYPMGTVIVGCMFMFFRAISMPNSPICCPSACGQARVSKFVRNMFTGISLGFARFDAFGNFGFVARIGFEPTVEMDEIMTEKFKLVEPMITNIVRRTLPWLLSREISQSQLPL